MAKKHKLGVDISYCFTFKANQNDDAAADLVKAAVNSTGHELIGRDHPFKWGEDFGLFTAKYKGCMFGLGSGEDMPALHNPDYDFPDEDMCLFSSFPTHQLAHTPADQIEQSL